MAKKSLPVVVASEKTQKPAIQEKVENSNPTLYCSRGGIPRRVSDLYELATEAQEIIQTTRNILQALAQENYHIAGVSKSLEAALQVAEGKIERIIPRQGLWGMFPNFVEQGKDDLPVVY